MSHRSERNEHTWWCGIQRRATVRHSRNKAARLYKRKLRRTKTKQQLRDMRTASRHKQARHH